MHIDAKKPSRLFRFIRNNLAIIIIVACLVAITTIILVATVSPNQDDIVPTDVDPIVSQPPNPITDNPNGDDGADPDDDNPDDSVEQRMNKYLPPVQEEFTIGMDYTNSTDALFVFNDTLNRWQAHRAVDFVAPEGTNVCAMKSGTVIEVGSNYGFGNYCVIDHGQGMVATYASLDNIALTQGQEVLQGDIIGQISTSASYEFLDGPHLHLEMTLNEQNVNPWDYIETEEEQELELSN